MVVGKRKVTRVGLEPMHRIKPERGALAFLGIFIRKMKPNVILALIRTLVDRFKYRLLSK